MKPTEEGTYWCLQHYVDRSTGKKGTHPFLQVVSIHMCRPPRTRKADTPHVLVASAAGWRERLDKLPDTWEWEKIDPPTFKGDGARIADLLKGMVVAMENLLASCEEARGWCVSHGTDTSGGPDDDVVTAEHRKH